MSDPGKTIQQDLLVGNRVGRQVTSDRPLGLGILAHIHVEVVLVDVDNLDPGVLHLHREGVTRLDDLVVVHRALPVAVMKLRGPDEGEEPRWIDLVDQALGYDLHIVPELFVKERHPTGDPGKRAKHLGLVWRILTGWRRKTLPNRWKDRRFVIAGFGELFFHPFGNPWLIGQSRQKCQRPWETPRKAKRRKTHKSPYCQRPRSFHFGLPSSLATPTSNA